jgi:hypothetical protein
MTPETSPICGGLADRGFAMLGEPLLRLAEANGAPVMVVTLGERQGAPRLRSLQRAFGIADDAPGGRMLGPVAAALEYVAALRLRDTLPPEVSTGEAGWEPDAAHLAVASIRLRLRPLAWLHAGSATDDPMVRRQVQDALDHAASALSGWRTRRRWRLCWRTWRGSWRSWRRCARGCCGGCRRWR